MNDYLGRDKMEKKKDSVICAIKEHQAKKRRIIRERIRYLKKQKNNFVIGVVIG